MTSPSKNSRAVEAALHRDQDGTFYLKYENSEQTYDVAMRNSPLAKAIDAYVASQQEVAAPVGDDFIQQARILAANQRGLVMSASKKVADQIDALCDEILRLRAASRESLAHPTPEQGRAVDVVAVAFKHGVKYPAGRWHFTDEQLEAFAKELKATS